MRLNTSVQKCVEQGSFDSIRTWTAENYRLELYDTFQVEHGKSMLAYEFFHQGRLIFQGADFGCSPLHAIDSDQAVGGLLTFLSLRPGDTDPEYFDDYTPAQLQFAHQEGENLASYAIQLEEGLDAV